jgi:diaminopropionate ammonia-lyase
LFINQRSLKKAASRQYRCSPDRPLKLICQCPAYAPTALLENKGLADIANVSRLWIKNESERMGLGSFKALGGAYAIAQIILDQCSLGKETGVVDPFCDEAKKTASVITFITASAGNHGLSVAAGAKVFGSKAVIILAETVSEGFADRIRNLDAEVVRVQGSYEDSVEIAMQTADSNDWVLLADGSWEGYTERPALIMEGYTVLAEECREKFEESGVWPSHVFLQAGVGGLAAATAAHIREYWAEQPEIIIVEPEAAPCLMHSVQAGKLTRADGLVSNMGRLDCKDASLITYDSLKDDADIFILISEQEAEQTADLCQRHGLSTTPSGVA